MKLRMAVIGAGSMGKKYAEWIGSGLMPELELAAVTTSNPDTGRYLREKVGEHLHICPSPQALFEDGQASFDAVLLATPHKEHLGLAKEAFGRGKHVLCEKPMSVTYRESEEMCLAAGRAGLSLGVMFQNRTLPTSVSLKELLESGALGALRRIAYHGSRHYRTAHYHASSRWRSSWAGEGGGALINQGQHPLDLWQWLFGMPSAMSAKIWFGKYNDFSVDDEASLQMEYPDKLTASFFFTTGELPKEERLEVVGSRGKVAVEGSTLTHWEFSEDLRSYGPSAGCVSGEGLTISEKKLTLAPPDNLYLDMLGNFARHVLAGEPLIASGESALGAIALCNAAYLSAWTGSTVSLPLDSDRYDSLLAQKIEEEGSAHG